MTMTLLLLIHQLGGIRHYTRVEYFNDSGFSATCNAAVAAELSDALFTICVDFVDVDKHFPRTRSTGHGASPVSCTSIPPCEPRRVVNQIRMMRFRRITATPVRGSHTDQDYVLLRQVAVIRYNLLPNSRLLHDEIRTAQSLSNGDLLIAHLQALSRSAQRRVVVLLEPTPVPRRARGCTVRIQ